jgi:hypothetical protein
MPDITVVEGEQGTPPPVPNPYVQAGLEYLCELYNVKALFCSFDLSDLDVRGHNKCVLAKAQQFESGEQGATYYDFVRSHVLPGSPEDFGFAIRTTLSLSEKEDDALANELNAAWKQVIHEVLA